MPTITLNTPADSKAKSYEIFTPSDSTIRTEIGDWRCLINNQQQLPLAKAVSNKDFEIIEVLKDSRKSFVAKVLIDGQTYLYKENKFLSRKGRKKVSDMIFEEASSFRQMQIMNLFHQHDIQTPKALVALEKKSFGLRTHSMIVQTFLEHSGEIGNEDYEACYQQLTEIHKLGFIHDDPVRGNFIKTKDGVAVIDYRAKKNHLAALGVAFESVKFAKRWRMPYLGVKNWAYYVAYGYFTAHRKSNRWWDTLRGA